MTGLPTSPSILYSQVRSQLNTGDLFFLHGISQAARLVEDLEQARNLLPYSHCGMVIKDRDDLYLWDAPGGGHCFPDPYATDRDNRLYGKYAKGIHPGCRVSDLDDVLAYYANLTDPAGKFWLRQLAPGVMTPDRFSALRLFINRVDGSPFSEGMLPRGWKLGESSALASNYVAGSKFHATFLFGTYFCSQLVADSYMHMGLLEMEGRPPNGYTPAALAMDALPLVPPAKLGLVTYVSWDGKAVNQPCDCPDYNPLLSPT